MSPDLKYYKNYWGQQGQQPPEPSEQQPPQETPEQQQKEQLDKEYQVELQTDRYVLDRTRYNWSDDSQRYEA